MIPLDFKEGLLNSSQKSRSNNISATHHFLLSKIVNHSILGFQNKKNISYTNQKLVLVQIKFIIRNRSSSVVLNTIIKLVLRNTRAQVYYTVDPMRFIYLTRWTSWFLYFTFYIKRLVIILCNLCFMFVYNGYHSVICHVDNNFYWPFILNNFGGKHLAERKQFLSLALPMDKTDVRVNSSLKRFYQYFIVGFAI